MDRLSVSPASAVTQLLGWGSLKLARLVYWVNRILGHVSWVNMHQPMTHVIHPKKWPIWPTDPWPIDPLPRLPALALNNFVVTSCDDLKLNFWTFQNFRHDMARTTSPDAHRHASPRTLSRVLPSLPRHIACHGVNLLSCQCEACLILLKNCRAGVVKFTVHFPMLILNNPEV